MSLISTREKHLLSKIYYDPVHPAGFGTLGKLYEATKKKINKQKISNWLLQQENYTRHKPRFNKFKRNHYLVDNIDDLWESDLIVLNDQFMKIKNNGYGYIIGKTNNIKIIKYIFGLNNIFLFQL